MKHTVMEMKNNLVGFTSKLDTSEGEEKINETEDESIEMLQTERQRQNELKMADISFALLLLLLWFY